MERCFNVKCSIKVILALVSAESVITLTAILTIFPSYYPPKLLQVKKWLEEKKTSCAIPILTPVSYQFAPPHTGYKTSFKCKSKFDMLVKFKDGKLVNIMNTLIMLMPIICKDKCFYLAHSMSLCKHIVGYIKVYCLSNKLNSEVALDISKWIGL